MSMNAPKAELPESAAASSNRLVEVFSARVANRGRTITVGTIY